MTKEPVLENSSLEQRHTSKGQTVEIHIYKFVHEAEWIYLEWWLCHRLWWVLAIQAAAQAEKSDSEANIVVYVRHLPNLG